MQTLVARNFMLSFLPPLPLPIYQVYQADSDNYKKRDKYWGRELTEEGLKHALFCFFHNGYTLRVHVIRRVLHKLEKMRRVIEKQSSYRFYSW